jgi:glyoxylase-like metal-dependent hydrolase (beta-lactamase superfamily II)
MCCKMLLAFVVLVGCTGAAAKLPYHLIAGAVPLNKGPDGNAVVLDAPDGLIVVDTGRHREHAQAILDYAKARHRPIAAIVNTHWHLDHTTGNWDIRRACPQVHVYASTALDGALATYLKQSATEAKAALDDPKTTPSQRDQIVRGRAVVDHPERIRPDRPVTRSGTMAIAGRKLDVHLQKFAATEGDVWIYDPKSGVAVVGDLVVGLVPFLDTACAEGWRDALGEIARLPFTTLIPGHGAPMSRADFRTWSAAYANLLDCANSDSPESACVDGWLKNAAKFIDADHHDYVANALRYYIEKRLRAPQEQARYCKPLGA